MKSTVPATFKFLRPSNFKHVYHLFTVLIHSCTKAPARVYNTCLFKASRHKGFAQKCMDIWGALKIQKRKKELWEKKMRCGLAYKENSEQIEARVALILFSLSFSERLPACYRPSIKE